MTSLQVFALRDLATPAVSLKTCTAVTSTHLPSSPIARCTLSTIALPTLPAFVSALTDDNIGVAIGESDQGGHVSQIDFMRFLSGASRAEGWTYFVLRPGVFYFAFLPQRRTDIFSYVAMFNKAQKWRLEVPENRPVVYAGTMHIKGIGRSLLFGGQYLVDFESMTVLDQRNLAKESVAQVLSELGAPITSLLIRQDGPIKLGAITRLSLRTVID